MTIECTACHARYTIADALVPPQGARVKCKKCGALIAVRAPSATVPAPTESTLVPPTPEPAPAPAPAPVSVPAPAPAAVSGPGPEPAPVFTSSIFEHQPLPFAAAPPPVPMEATPSPVVAAPAPPPPVAPSPPSAIPTGTPIPEGLSPDDRQKHERARRLARVLASDVAIYNREKRERGMADGNLVAVLGYEIKKSWETYKERVGTDFANATPYFRDALNEIVAEGRKIF